MAHPGLPLQPPPPRPHLRRPPGLGKANTAPTLAPPLPRHPPPPRPHLPRPPGVGKATTARALAALFLCECPTKDAQPCEKCDACRVFEAGNHPDYAVVYRQLVRVLLDKEEIKAK